MTAIDTQVCRTLFDTARQRLRAERRRLVDEREAFRAFEQHVRKLDGQGGSTQPARSTRLTVTEHPQGLQTVKSAYESTVMAVPHYDDEYGESFEEHVTGEFGPEIATLLTQATVLDPQSKQTLLGAASQARNRRDALVDALDAEQEALAPASRELLSLVDELTEYEEATFATASFGTLDAYRLRLSVLAENCEEVVDDRQEALVRQRKSLSLPIDGPDVPTYVYQGLETTYPVVSTAATVLERIESLREDVERAIIYES